MNKEHTLILFEENPQLYLDRDTLSDSSLKYFRFAVDDGWFNIIRELSSKLTKLIRSEISPDLVVYQVKQRFGGLKFLTNLTNEYIEEAVQAAENEAWSICEMCGDNGTLHHRTGFLKTLCIHCAMRVGYQPVGNLEENTSG